MAFLERERVEPYQDTDDFYGQDKTFTKYFRKGGPLEWYNPPEMTDMLFPSIVYVGTREEFGENARRIAEKQWDQICYSLMEIPMEGVDV